MEAVGFRVELKCGRYNVVARFKGVDVLYYTAKGRNDAMRIKMAAIRDFKLHGWEAFPQLRHQYGMKNVLDTMESE